MFIQPILNKIIYQRELANYFEKLVLAPDGFFPGLRILFKYIILTVRSFNPSLFWLFY